MQNSDEVDLTELIDLKPKKIKMSHIFLDPNNPRLTKLTVGLKEERVADDKIMNKSLQSELLQKIKEGGLSDIMDKIKKVGFLPIDRIVVRPIEGHTNKYVVLEGNRRIASLKILINDKKLSLSPRIVKSMGELQVLEYDGENKDIAWTLQGLRHISGVKSWGPYQQAKFLMDLQDRRKLPITDLAKVAGLGRSKASQLIRSYYGLMQAAEDEDYGDLLDESSFSIFQEAIFHRTESPLWKWLEWDDDDRKFKNETNLKKLLSLNTSEDKNEPRIKRVNPDLRDYFSKIVDLKHEKILERFMNGDIDLDEAIREVSEEETEIETKEELVDLDFQLGKITEMSNSIMTLPLPKIKNSTLKDEFITSLEDLKKTLEEQLKLLKIRT